MLTYLRIALGLAFAVLLGWALRLDYLRAYWHDKFDALSNEAATVLVSMRDATDNPKLQWRDVPAQIDQMDASLTSWKSTAEQQTELVDTLGRNTERLRKENADLQAKIAEANRKRDRAIAKLENDALDPGDRADCWVQIRASDEALNKLYQENF
jgi:chromosome segregation ATPase